MSLRTIRLTQGNGGAMLLELVCALFIVTMGLFGIMQMYLVAMDKTRGINEYAIASTALNNEIETLRAMPFDDLVVGERLPFLSETPSVEMLADAKGSVVIRDRRGETAGLKEARVALRWRGEHGRVIEKSFVTMIASKE